MLMMRAAGLGLAFAVTGVPVASAQPMLAEVMARHGIVPPGGSFERAFDEGMTSSTPVAPGSLATPLALMTSATGSDRNAAAYAFGVLAGRVFAVAFEARTAPSLPSGLVDALFALLNRDGEVDQLAAMDALGLMRIVTAVQSLTDRYFFYRQSGRRALAGGALEALARIGDASTLEIVKVLVVDKWSDGRDATAQARGYLAELGVSIP
jgi:hypothetical protein